MDRSEVVRRLDAQRETVRSLKQAKSDSVTIEKAVFVLKELKQQLEQLDHGASSDATTVAGPKKVVEDAAASSDAAVVTPWDVGGTVDYDKLVADFGSSRITTALLERFEKVTGVAPHPWLRRGIFFSHRDLQAILDALEAGKPVYLYTGRGPSNGMHLGHLVPFMFTKWLHDALQCPLVIQLTDDEKTIWKNIDLSETRALGIENARDILALGFEMERTFVFRDSDYIGHMYPTIIDIQRSVTTTTVRSIFGFTDADAIGKIAFPAIQAAPSFPSAFPHIFGLRRDVRCLIPCGIDQDPYFRMTRDIAPKLGFHKPSLVHSMFFPPLQGVAGKMSSSNTASAVFLTDTAKEIEKKINKHAFSGGGKTKEEQIANGANLDIDVAYQWLRFLEHDDEVLRDVAERYGSGKMFSGEVKAILIKKVQAIVEAHQKNRELQTDEVVRKFMELRPLKGRNL
nr:tryptophanyl-tRNA synthetase [Andalucia godoyi]|eukprot:ANDGO_02973.mRNA.1 Tryptophan--tRNA ligase